MLEKIRTFFFNQPIGIAFLVRLQKVDFLFKLFAAGFIKLFDWKNNAFLLEV